MKEEFFTFSTGFLITFLVLYFYPTPSGNFMAALAAFAFAFYLIATTWVMVIGLLIDN